MTRSVSLFCPDCCATLVTQNSAHSTSSCAVCGFVLETTQRIVQKITLPSAVETSNGFVIGSNNLWVWGIQKGNGQLLRLDPTGSKIQATFSSPNNWQVSRLAPTENILILSPWEPNPPGSSKALVGIQLETGKALWEHATSGFMFTAPAADEELTCAVDSHGTLIAVNPLNGKAAWASFPQLGDYPHRGIPPVLSRKHVLAVESEARGAGLIAFHRSTGEVAWEFHPPENSKVDFAPAIWNDAAFVLAGEWLHRVALADGTWKRLSRSGRKSSQGWYFAPPVVDEEHVYLVEANFVNGKPAYVLHAHDSSTGLSLWQMNLSRRPYQPPALLGDHVYFVDRAGELFCLNKQDGQIIWQEHLSAEPADAPVFAGEVIFVLTKDAVLHTIKLSTPALDISQPPDFYEKRDEWSQAAGAYLSKDQPFKAGLALLKINDHRQANLAFSLVPDAELRILELRQSFLDKKNDIKAGELSEDWGSMLIERLGEQSQGNAQIAEWFEQAAESYMLANQTMEAFACRERAAQVMETPRIKLEVITGENARWAVNEPVLLQVQVTNFGYGPARRVTVKVSGNIKRPHLSQSFVNLAVDQSQRWDNIRVIPNSPGAGLLEFILDYESYRTGQVIQTRFTHPIFVEKNRDTAILRAMQGGAQIHIEKFISPGATHNEIEITDSQGIAVGDQAQIQPVPVQSIPEIPGIKKEIQMDPVTLIVSALLGGLTAGLTDTATAATKDLYNALKSRLMRKVEKNEDAQDAIAKVEKQPDSKARQELLKEELAKLELDKDDELLKIANSLLEALKASGGSSGKYDVDIHDSQGIVVGDHSSVTQNFGAGTEKKKKANE